MAPTWICLRTSARWQCSLYKLDNISGQEFIIKVGGNTNICHFCDATFSVLFSIIYYRQSADQGSARSGKILNLLIVHVNYYLKKISLHNSLIKSASIKNLRLNILNFLREAEIHFSISLILPDLYVCQLTVHYVRQQAWTKVGEIICQAQNPGKVRLNFPGIDSPWWPAARCGSCCPRTGCAAAGWPGCRPRWGRSRNTCPRPGRRPRRTAGMVTFSGIGLFCNPKCWMLKGPRVLGCSWSCW